MCLEEAAACLISLVCSKAAGKKSLLHTGRLWPASGAPKEERKVKDIIKEHMFSWKTTTSTNLHMKDYLYGEAVCHHHDDQWYEEGHKRTNQHKALLIEDTTAVDKDLVLIVEADHWNRH